MNEVVGSGHEILSLVTKIHLNLDRLLRVMGVVNESRK